MATKTSPDLTVLGKQLSTMYRFRPNTSLGRTWLATRVERPSTGAQRDGSIYVEHGYVVDLLRAAEADGLTVRNGIRGHAYPDLVARR